MAAKCVDCGRRTVKGKRRRLLPNMCERSTRLPQHHKCRSATMTSPPPKLHKRRRRQSATKTQPLQIVAADPQVPETHVADAVPSPLVQVAVDVQVTVDVQVSVDEQDAAVALVQMAYPHHYRLPEARAPTPMV
ncbi:hypothetical protein SPRG_03970 [Saprolegnia parasitica CBS 223.65]|uniref:Uncharacterized protein n=1 Tax=Saprolegnia parasitica (strain CBS 223.65) TaxID=695850 RepID=A0A067CLG6_SAPPC|nr:hypothetical protein SPRG_03970 [Saprolegnia parasitica CBS 223.65]KDO31353.1 hypothetical protein SPRG_03970 [Saprolegnia parasitica CBS 223.65]|eukprot:XP_012197952.1 hypothetical protein SPRG_03970 [Saprolegnia parasitica CBS 223.65]